MLHLVDVLVSVCTCAALCVYMWECGRAHTFQLVTLWQQHSHECNCWDILNYGECLVSASTVGLYKEANIKHIVCYMSCYDGFKISRQLKRLFTELLSRPAGGWNTNVFTVNSIVDLVLTRWPNSHSNLQPVTLCSHCRIGALMFQKPGTSRHSRQENQTGWGRKYWKAFVTETKSLKTTC